MALPYHVLAPAQHCKVDSPFSVARPHHPSLCIIISNLMIGQLHTFLFGVGVGVMQQYCRELVWELILSDAWHVKDGRTEAEMLEVSVARL